MPSNRCVLKGHDTLVFLQRYLSNRWFRSRCRQLSDKFSRPPRDKPTADYALSISHYVEIL